MSERAAAPAGAWEGADAGAELRLPTSTCLRLCDALPKATDLHSAMCVIEGARRDLLGDGLLTVNLVALPLALTLADSADCEIGLQRAWSSDPVAYPVGGRKRKTATAWSRHLLLQGQVFVGEGDAALALAFDDHTRITSLGLHAVVNVPLLDRTQRCFATFNALGTRARWRAEEILAVRLLAALAAPAITRAAQDDHTPTRSSACPPP